MARLPNTNLKADRLEGTEAEQFARMILDTLEVMTITKVKGAQGSSKAKR
jgi:hypothetical protein